MDIPPLGMVDDLICVSECGHKTAMAHSYIKFKTDTKKLLFRRDKCKKLHVGKYIRRTLNASNCMLITGRK